jgi:hypothetical protein
MQRDPLILLQPPTHILLLVGGVVVTHNMQRNLWVLFCDSFEELAELLMTVTRIAGINHLASRDLQRRNSEVVPLRT